MTEKVFVATGTYREKGNWKNFMKEVKAVNQNYAREKLLAGMGSRHKVGRNAIKIASINEK